MICFVLSPFKIKIGHSASSKSINQFHQQNTVRRVLSCIQQTPSSQPPPSQSHETDERGFLIPRVGDVVLFSGRWAGEDSAGIVQNVQYNKARKSHIIDVNQLRRITADLFEVPSGRRKLPKKWYDPAALRIAQNAEYIKSQDAYRILGTSSGYAPVKEVTEEEKREIVKEYEKMKREMINVTVISGLVGFAGTALLQGFDIALPFAYGAFASVVYLGLLQASVDAVGQANTFGNKLLSFRFAVPILPFLVISLPKLMQSEIPFDVNNLIGSVSKEEGFAVVIGLLCYKVPLFLKTSTELIDGLSRIELGKTGMVGTVATLTARKVKQLQEENDKQEQSMNVEQTTKPVLIFAGPSGVGKSTLIRKLIQQFPNTFEYTVSHTTREKRAEEKDGVDYHFVKEEEFEHMIEQDEFVEFAKVHGQYYGTSYDSVKKVIENGRFCILDVDVQGIEAMRQKESLSWENRFIWIAPPSIESLETRLRERATETEDSLRFRMNTAMREMEYAATNNVFDITIFNDDVNRAYEELQAFVVKQLDI